MEEKITMSILCQLYGKLLTEKQYKILDDYYNNDLSFSEIAENDDITRQAVNDVISKGKKKLLEIEDELLLMKKSLDQRDTINEIIDFLKQLENKELKKTQIEKISKQLEKLI